MASIIREPHITKVPKSARELRDDLAVRMQLAVMRSMETTVLEEPMRVFREAIEIAVRETITATQMREPTKQDRKDAPNWSNTVDIMRDAVESAANWWVLGL